MKHTKVKTLLLGEAVNDTVCVKGWVRTKRGSKNVSFIAINDGSTINNIQVVADSDSFNESLLKQITTGACLSIVGTLIESQGSGQKVEIAAQEIEVLGEKLNKALTSKVFELQKYRSEFFGKLQALLGDREDIKIVGDRFIFETELLFDSASADLQESGKEKLSEIGLTLKETTVDIPSEIVIVLKITGFKLFDFTPLLTDSAS